MPPLFPQTLVSLHAEPGAVLLVLVEYEPAVADYQRPPGLIRRVGDRRIEMDILSW